jgi:hypothetical protein
LKPAPSEFNEVDYDPDTHRLVYIHVVAQSPDPTSIHLEDWDALGLWGVLVPRDLDHGLVANCAADAFHTTVPIKLLFSVSWTIRDAESGCRLVRDESVEWYTLQEHAASVQFVAHMG